MTDQQPVYRWVIVGACALILAIAMGAIVNGLSAFIVPMQQQFGWHRGEVAFINFSGILGLALGGLLFGRLADKKGARPVVLFGAIVLGASYLLASVATALWQYYLVFFIAGFFGAAAIFAPVIATVGNWFSTGAGMAIGIATAGQALGQGGVPFVSSFLILRFGASGALAVTGAFMLLTLVPLSLLLRPFPAPHVTANSGAPAEEGATYSANRVVVTLCVAIILCCTCMSVPLMHLMPLIQDRGIAAVDAGGVIFTMLVVAIFGRLAFGILADKIGALAAYMTATAWMALMVFGFTMVETLETFYLYAVVYGFGYAGVMTGVLITIRVLVPISRRASAFGIITMFGWFGHAIGGYLGGVLYDYSGDYTLAYGVAAAAGLLNLVVVSTLLAKGRQAGRLVDAV